MPRKEDGMPFEVYPSPMKDKKGNNLLYVRPMHGRSITLKEIDEQCTQNTGMSRNDMVNAFNYFFDACAEFLADGRRVETPMGTFAPRLSLKREITDADDVQSTDVEWRGVEFVPSRQFMQKVRQWSRGFHRAPSFRSAQTRPTEQQLQQALARCMVSGGGYVKISAFCVHSGLTRHIAQRYLDQLCQGDHAQLKRTQMGRTYVYTSVE